MDKEKCSECSCEFEYSDGLSSVFADLHFSSAIKRCTDCWKAKVGSLWDFPTKDKSAICEECGKKFIVYFKVTESSSLLCKRCFSQKDNQEEDC
jgi:hypothetical protein